MKKNIAIITSTLQKGGTEKQCLLTAKELKNFYSVHLVVLNNSDVALDHKKFISQYEINVIYLNGSLIKKVYLFITFLKNKKIECILAYLASGNIFSAFFGKISGVKSIWGGIRSSHLSYKKMILQRFIHNNILDGTIFNSYSGMEYMVKKWKFKRNKCQIIHNAIELSKDEICRVKSKIVKVITVTRFVDVKDIYSSLNAIISLNKKNIRLFYYLLGYGPLEKKIKEYVKQNRMEEYVSIVINPESEKIQEKYLDSDIYLSSSLIEGLSNSIMEAMTYSLPIVATNVGDNNYLVIDNENGYLVPTKSPEKIADRLRLLIESYEKRIAFGKRSLKIITNEFSCKKLRDNYIKIINK